MNTPLLNIAKMALISCGLLALAACGGGGGYGGGGGGGGGGGTAPSALTYTGSTMVTVGTAITSLSPTVTGTVTSYSVSPALPAGLTLNTTSGVVSGTPTAATAQATYTITAMNSYGSTTFPLVLTVNSAASVTVPNVVGNTKTAATTAITGAGLVVGTVSMQSSSTVASGNVISESPAAGTSVANGSAVNLVVSSGAAGAGFTISGTVSGPWVAGVTVTLSGAGTGTATTDASGNYSISGLAAGTYMVKPSLAGYTYNPSAPSVAVTANSTQNFTASSALVSYSISGTVSYAGSKTGRIIVGVLGNCTGCNQALAVTSVTLSAGSAAYTVRGLSNGSYFAVAGIDVLGNVVANASNPIGNSAVISISGGNATGVNITMSDPATVTPVVPTGLSVSPGDASALIQYQPPLDSNRREIATAYKLYWGTDVNASTGGGSATFGAQGINNNAYFAKPLANVPLYFKLSALVGATESAASAVVGPVTIGATTGVNTISGAITFSGAATGPMFVGVYNSSTNNLYYKVITNPVSPQSYSVAGVPNGSYQPVALIDMNNNGVIDTGDITNVARGSRPTLVTVSGNTTSNLTLSSAPAVGEVQSNYNASAASSGYYLQLRALDGTKRVVAAVLYSGPNVPVPYDLGPWSDSGLQFNLGTAVPTVGDTFALQVTYSDGTTSNISATVTAVLGASAVATGLSVNTATSRTIPTFTWATPSSPPASYVYYLYINGSDANWGYDNKGLGMPSTQLSVLYNVNGGATKSALTTGVTYSWRVTVIDAAGNSAVYQVSYTP